MLHQFRCLGSNRHAQIFRSVELLPLGRVPFGAARFVAAVRCPQAVSRDDRPNSSYFFDSPFAFAIGYFSAFFCTLADTAVVTSIPVMLANCSRSLATAFARGIDASLSTKLFDGVGEEGEGSRGTGRYRDRRKRGTSSVPISDLPSPISRAPRAVPTRRRIRLTPGSGR